MRGLGGRAYAGSAFVIARVYLARHNGTSDPPRSWLVDSRGEALAAWSWCSLLIAVFGGRWALLAGTGQWRGFARHPSWVWVDRRESVERRELVLAEHELE